MRFRYLLCLLLFTGLASLAEAQRFPPQRTLVIDEPGVLSPGEKYRLERDLLDYERETGVEILVVIVRTLGGYDLTDYGIKAFEHYKPGKRKDDNGVLFLIALDDRKMRIGTGYGVEHLLTDARCKRIIEETIIPRFKDAAQATTPEEKSAHMSTGIFNGVEEMQVTLGRKNRRERLLERQAFAEQERLAAIEAERQAAARREQERIERAAQRERDRIEGLRLAEQERLDAIESAKFWSGVRYYGGIALLLGIIIGALRLIQRMMRERARRNAVRQEIRSAYVDLDGVTTKTQQRLAADLKDATELLPHEHYRDIIDGYASKKNAIERDLAQQLSDCERLLEPNPDRAKDALDRAQKCAVSLSALMTEIEGRIQAHHKAREAAPQTILDADAYASAQRMRLQKLVDAGYRIEPDTLLAPALEKIANARAQLALSVPDPEEALEHCAASRRCVDNAVANAEGLPKLRAQNETKTRSLTEKIPDLKAKLAAARDLLANLEKTFGPSVWAGPKREIASLEGVPEALLSAIGEAGRRNSMETQDFTGAQAALEAIASRISAAYTTAQAPQRALDAQNEAKRRVDTITREISQKDAEAASIVRHSDVGAHAERLLQSARSSYQQLASASKKVDDWTVVAASYASAKQAFQACINAAQSDIDAAERERERLREIERQRLAAIAAAEAARLAAIRAEEDRQERQREQDRRDQERRDEESRRSNDTNLGGGRTGGGGANGEW